MQRVSMCEMCVLLYCFCVCNFALLLGCFFIRIFLVLLRTRHRLDENMPKNGTKFALVSVCLCVRVHDVCVRASRLVVVAVVVFVVLID